MTINNFMKSEAIRNIGQGALTNSKHWDRFIAGVYPTHIDYGRDCYLYDSENKKYVDFICGLGTNLLGYGNQAIMDKVVYHAFQGSCHSLPTKHEVQASGTVKDVFPFIEKLKFLNDGSSACSASLIMARAYTGRSLVYSSGYHGWHNEFISLTDPSYGIPSEFKSNIRQYEHYDMIDCPKDVAAIIVEPVELDDGTERIAHLHGLRSFCSKNGICLIFDEVITGLRYPKLSVSGRHGIIPDIILLSKAIANGEKIAVVGGSKDILDGPYFCSGTFHGHVSSLVALIYTLKLVKHNTNYDVEALNRRTIDFVGSMNALTKPYFEIVGWGNRGAFKGDLVCIAKFFQEMCKAGFLFGPSFFSNFHLIDHFDKCLKIVEIILNKGFNNIGLEGPMPTSPFSTKLRKG